MAIRAGAQGTIHLLVDPSGDGLFAGVFEGATGAILTAEGLHAEQGSHDFVARQGSDMGIPSLADEDGVDVGSEDFRFGRRVGAGVSQRAGIDESCLSVTDFQEVDEVSQTFIPGNGWGGLPASSDGATKGV